MIKSGVRRVTLTTVGSFGMCRAQSRFTSKAVTARALLAHMGRMRHHRRSGLTGLGPIAGVSHTNESVGEKRFLL